MHSKILPICIILVFLNQLHGDNFIAQKTSRRKLSKLTSRTYVQSYLALHPIIHTNPNVAIVLRGGQISHDHHYMTSMTDCQWLYSMYISGSQYMVYRDGSAFNIEQSAMEIAEHEPGEILS